jgi:hypothetical protein
MFSDETTIRILKLFAVGGYLLAGSLYGYFMTGNPALGGWAATVALISFIGFFIVFVWWIYD